MTPVLTLDPDTDVSLTMQIVAGIIQAVDDKRWRPGERVPSIRAFANAHGVSTFTVVEAYDRLVAQGVLLARRGSGFYVSDRRLGLPQHSAEKLDEKVTNGWLVRNVLEGTQGAIHAGAGWLPETWLDGEGIARALRQLSAQPESLLGYGDARGYGRLREQIRRQLGEYEIDTDPSGVMTTLGANQALDLVVRRFTQPGDTVLVDAPCYSDLLVSLRMRDVETVGIPMTPTGPDLAALDTALQTRRPRLYVTNSRLHNPTGASYSSSAAYQVLKAAERHDCLIVEDDVSADLVRGAHFTLASMDQLKNVIYVGSFSKTIGAGLRVGFVVADKDVVEGLLYQKLVSGMSTPTVTEGLVSAVLAEGHYRKQTEQLKDRLAKAQERVCRRLEGIGFEVFCEPGAGMFVWARPSGVACDSAVLAEQALKSRILLAPGHLFFSGRERTAWTRFNVAHSNVDRLFGFLQNALDT